MSKKEKQPEEVTPEEQTAQAAAPEAAEEAPNPLLEELEALNLPTSEVTDDLHANGPVGIMTGYEEKFYNLGTPIHRCVVTTHHIFEENDQ